MFHNGLKLKGGRGEGSMVPSERTSKSPIGTLGNIGRERGLPGSRIGPIVKLTNRWERDRGRR